MKVFDTSTDPERRAQINKKRENSIQLLLFFFEVNKFFRVKHLVEK